MKLKSQNIQKPLLLRRCFAAQGVNETLKKLSFIVQLHNNEHKVAISDLIYLN